MVQDPRLQAEDRALVPGDERPERDHRREQDEQKGDGAQPRGSLQEVESEEPGDPHLADVSAPRPGSEDEAGAAQHQERRVRDTPVYRERQVEQQAGEAGPQEAPPKSGGSASVPAPE